MSARPFHTLLLAVLLAALPAGCGQGERHPPEPDPPLTGTISVVNEGQLWLLAADGSEKRRIDFGADWAGTAMLSPGGRRIAFDTGNGIWVAPIADGQATMVPGLPAAFERPSFDASWSPNGHTIAFAGEQGIYSVDLEDERPRARLLFGDVRARDPEWSGDGSQIAFVRGKARRFIWLMNADGSRARRLTAGDDPAFSHDGSMLAFRRVAGVYVLRLDGRQRPRLLARNGYEPAWAPSGPYVALKRQLAVCGEAGCDEEIRIVRASSGSGWGDTVSTLEEKLVFSSELGWTGGRLPEQSFSISFPSE